MAAETLPKFTVIIPTRARADVLHAALKTVVAQDYDNLEILVSDNFSEDDTAEIVGSFDDPRIRYINTGRRLSMSHNWEFALSHVEKGWVTILGDDDGLLPGALVKVSELAANYGVSAVRSSTCKYRWPRKDGTGARLSIPMQRGVEMRDSKAWLQKTLEGRATYMDLPMLYTGGFADMQVMHEIKARMGAFYSSCIPDVYSGVAITSVTPDYLYSHAPLAIAGISKHSTGTSHFSRPPSDNEMTPTQRFMSEENIPFHPGIPVCSDGVTPRSPQVTFFETFLQSLPLREALDHSVYADQLEIVAAGHSGKDKDLEIWMEDFARLHNIDLKRAARRGYARRIKSKIFGAAMRIYKRRRSLTLRAPKHLIGDVYLGSKVAASRLPTRGRQTPDDSFTSN